MKTMIITMIFIVLLSAEGISQIKLERTVASKYKLIQMDDGANRYVEYNVEKKTIYIYNLDHTLWRSIHLLIPKNHHLDDVKLVSQNVFNKDDLVEVVYSCVEYIVPENNEDPAVDFDRVKFTLNITNEIGKTLLRVEDSNEMEIVRSTDISNLLVYRYIDDGFGGDNQTLIYQLP
jgi:hypothetical protein